MAGFGAWLRGLHRKELTPSGTTQLLPRERPAVPRSFATDSNEFALDLYEQLRPRPGNLFFSPFSIRTALAMAHAGARGETAANMRDALCISSPDEKVSLGFVEAVARLNTAGNGECAITVANSLWGQEGALPLPEFLDLIARHYAGAMNVVDFGRGTEATDAINRWVEDHTRQKIRQLVPPGGLDAETRLVLANAVHFKGTWAQQFQRVSTSVEPFHMGEGRTVQVPLMHHRARVGYAEARSFQAVDLSYRGGDLSMLVLLPNRKGGLPDLETSLYGVLDECVAQMSHREVSVFLPRFRIEWGTVDLREPLSALGMRLAFTRFKADFSGINGYEPPHEASLYISAALHKAFVDVNEEGTEAAAATGVSMMPARGLRRLPPVPTFRADHPFLFAIRERTSGTILFLGRVAAP